MIKDTQLNKNLAKEAKKIHLFSKEPVFKALMKLSLAAFINMFIFSIYEITDALVAVNLGSFHNFSGASIRLALQVTTPIYTIGFAFAIMIAIGMSTRISIAMGKKDYQKIETILANGLAMFFIIMVIVCIILSITIPFMAHNFSSLAPIQEQANIQHQSSWYAWILLWGLLINGLNIFGAAYLRAEGALVISSVSSIIGVILNIAGDLIFLIVFKLSLIGSAISTVMAWGAQLGIMIGYLFIYDRKNPLFTCFKKFKLSKTIIWVIILAGLSPLIRNIGSSFSSLIVNSLIKILPNSAEDQLLSTFSTATQITIVFLIPSFGIIQGAQAFIGYNTGIKDNERLKKSLVILLIFLFIYFAMAEIIIMTLHHPLLAIFAGQISSGSDHSIYFNQGTHMIFFSFSMLFLIAPQLTCQTYYQAMGYSKIAILISSLRYTFCFFPIVLILSIISISTHNSDYFWFYLPITDLLASIISFYYLKRLYDNLNQKDFIK